MVSLLTLAGCALPLGGKQAGFSFKKGTPSQKSQGTASKGKSSTIGRRSSGTSQSQASASRKGTSSHAKTKSSSPKSKLAQSGTDSKSVPSTKETTPASATPPSATTNEVAASGLDRFDPTTRALIESELRDSTPQDRAEILKELSGVPSEMVPRILRTWRLGMSYRKKHLEETPNKVVPAGGTAPEAGFGKQNPWNTNYPPGTGTVQAGHVVPAGTSANLPAESAAQAATMQTAMTPQGMEQSAMLAQQMAAVLGNSGSVTALTRGSTGPGGIPMAGGMPPMGAIPQLNPQLNQWSNLPGTIPSPATGTPTGMNPQNPVQLGSPQGNSDLVSTSNPAPNPLPPTISPPQSSSVVATGLTNDRSSPSPPSVGSSPSPTGQVPAVPVTVVRSPQSLEALQRMISVREAEVATLTPGSTEQEKQRYIEAHVQLRMLYMMAGEQHRALQSIPGIDPADQEFWQNVVWGLSNYFDLGGIPNTADRASQTVQQLQVANTKLREKARLELRNVGFCSKIDGFGVFQRFQQNDFTASQQVLLYAEVINFRSQITPDGKYRTQLNSTYEILRPGGVGEIIDQKKFQSIVDECVNPRQDFFLNFVMELPKTIAPGPYVLKLTVEDEQGRKVATHSVNFTVR